MNKTILFGALFFALTFFSACGDSVEESSPAAEPTEKPIESGVLSITLPADQRMKLQRKKESALEYGVLVNTGQDYAKGEMMFNGKSYSIEIRLKGKDTESLNNAHLSYKIKVKGGNFNGMRSFSIHLPEEKAGSKEWALHEILKQNNLLTPRYGFVKVSIDGKDAVVYAWEEHYDKQLVESNGRREGPLVKFEDQSKLDALKRGLDQVELYPFLKEAEIVAYKEGKTMSSPVLSAQFMQAKILMNQFRQGKVGESIDLKSFAAIKAISDLWAENEVFLWDQLRFYYNPILSRLEPIGNDFFGSAKGNLDYSSSKLKENILKSKEFQKYYEEALMKYNQESFIEEAKASLEEKYQDFKEFEVPLNLDFIRAKELEPSSFVNELKPIDKFDVYEPIAGMGLQAISSEENKVSLKNLHVLSLEILGLGNKVSVLKENNIILNSKRTKTMTIDTLDKYVYYRVQNRDKVYKSKIQKGSDIRAISSREKFMRDARLPAGYRNLGDTLLLSGRVSIRKNVVIPRDKVLKIEKGTVIEIRDAAFVCLGAIYAEGSSEEPIQIISEGANGFTVLSAPSRSKLSHVSFTGLNTLIEPGWTLTGAVNFYASDVDIDHCTFQDNVCEDALNIINSDFTLTNSLVQNTFGDGFDADFTTGLISESKFYNTGNDCLDFSGSEITLTNCDVNQSGDKGISGGEASTLTCSGITIKNSKIALAAKDHTVMMIKDSSISDCVYGFTVFQKKSEFGSAVVQASNMEINRVDTLKIIDLNSELELNGETFKGDLKIDVEALYGI